MHGWQLRVLPRQWQEDALELWKNQMRGVASIVTGGGKTIFAYLCMLVFREQFINGRFLIVVPTVSLLDQWYVGLREDLNIPENEISTYSGLLKPKQPNIVNLVVINTARTVISQISDGTDTFLIVDECHRAGSPENAKIFAGQYRATLGLSATPKREYDEGFETQIAPSLGNIIYEYDYVKARRDGIITPFQLINVSINLLDEEQKEYDRLTRKAAIELQRLKNNVGSEDVIRNILQRRAGVSASAVMRVPVAAKLVELHRGQRTIVFHERVDSANKIAQILQQRSSRVTIYHSEIGSNLRRDNLRLYRKGIFDVLVSCRALDEGINVPETEVAIIASATASIRQRIQRLGRVLRPSSNKEMATIYTLYATKQEENRLRDEAERLEDITSISWLRAT